MSPLSYLKHAYFIYIFQVTYLISDEMVFYHPVRDQHTIENQLVLFHLTMHLPNCYRLYEDTISIHVTDTTNRLNHRPNERRSSNPNCDRANSSHESQQIRRRHIIIILICLINKGYLTTNVSRVKCNTLTIS